MGRRLKLDTSRFARKGAWDPQSALSKALADRQAFLDENPRFKAYQLEIDRMLDKAGSQENRMTVLAMLMEGKLVELHHQLKRLNGILLRALA